VEVHSAGHVTRLHDIAFDAGVIDLAPRFTRIAALWSICQWPGKIRIDSPS
jgi:hypothetical protein